MKNLYLMLVVVFIVAACTNKNKEKTPDPIDDGGGSEIPMGSLRLHIHNYVDEEEIDGYDIVYTNSLGRKVSFSIAQLYLSGFQLVRLDGTVYDVPEVVNLKTQANLVYDIGNVPIGNYKSIRFKVGLDPSTNQKVPTTDANDVLNSPEMWFGSSAQPDGYVFVNFQGKIDTTSDASGATVDMQPFEFKIGTNAQYRQVNMPESNFTVVKDQVVYNHIKIDCTRLWTGVALNDASNLIMNTTIDNSSSLGVQLGNNIPSMFFLEY